MFKMGLSKKEERLIRDKIGLWVRHQELDKFNYNDAAIKLLGLIAGFIALVAITLQSIGTFLTKQSASTWLWIILAAAVFVFFFQRYKMNIANRHFVRREEMIDDWYEKLGVKKEELNKEFLKRYCKPCWLF